jgi:hypothetical protein
MGALVALHVEIRMDLMAEQKEKNNQRKKWSKESSAALNVLVDKHRPVWNDNCVEYS